MPGARGPPFVVHLENVGTKSMASTVSKFLYAPGYSYFQPPSLKVTWCVSSPG